VEPVPVVHSVYAVKRRGSNVWAKVVVGVFIIDFIEVYDGPVPRQLEPFAPGVLALRRVKAGMSLARLADAVGVSTRQIVYYEQGRHSPTPARLKKLADVLGTTAQDLAGVPEGEESLADLRRFAGLDRVRAADLLARRVPGVTVWKLQAVESGVEVRAWEDPAVLKRVTASLAGLYGVPVSKVRFAWFRTFPQQAHLLRPARSRASVSQKLGGGEVKAELLWRGLNDRQRSYLTACYRVDQEREDAARRERVAGRDPGPASRWRKLPFTIKADPTFTGYTDIQERLRSEGHHDPGAGATLQALARRGLILVCEDEVEVFPVGFVPRVLVELTRLGRACARAGLGESPPRASKGLLSEWLWRDFVKVAVAGAQGLPEDGLWGRARFYLGTGFRPRGVMSRGFIDRVPVREGIGGDSYVKEYRWQLTEAGRRHLAECLETYREMYPGVATYEL
jgi:transcriptional regulator with XRE-family HTH domain